MNTRRWSLALTLDERRALVPEPARPSPDTGETRALEHHQRWAPRPIHATVEDLAERLGAGGYSVAEYAGFSDLGTEVAVPPDRPWVGLLSRVCANWATLQDAGDGTEPPEEPVRAALHAIVRPFAADLLRAFERDIEGLRQEDPARVLTGSGLAETLVLAFHARARKYSDAVVALELHRMRNRLELDDGGLPVAAERFLARIRRAEGYAVLEQYPVLARTLADLVLQEQRNGVELLRRVRDDATLLGQVFEDGRHLGPLAEISDPWGDHHRGGRSVRKLRFEAGRSLLYKPRSLAIDAFVAQFLQWLNSTGIEASQRPVAVVDRGDYGWAEVVEPTACATAADVERFYRRQGGLVAVAYVLGGKDLHFENVIAEGDMPVAVDLEAFFQPRLPRQHGEEPYSGGALEVLESRLLPQGLDRVEGRLSRFDRSGIGGGGGGMPVTINRLSPPERGLRYERVQGYAEPRPNQPVLDGRRVSPADNVSAVVQGFREVAHMLRERRAELIGPRGMLERAATATIRVFMRPTSTYVRVLEVTRHPDVMLDMLDRERALDLLWPDATAPPAYRAVFPAERRALLQADIPVFLTTPGETEVRDGDGTGAGVLATVSGLEVSHRRLVHLDKATIDDLAWVVRASLDQTAGEAADRRPPLVPGPRVPSLLAEQLRERAGRVAGLIARRAEQGPDGTVWAGFTRLDDGWVFGPLRNDLFHGNAGIALFLAYAGTCTGDQRFSKLARQSIDVIRVAVEDRLTAVDDGKGAADLGGAFQEYGGAALALAHLAVLWGEDHLAREASAVIAAVDRHLSTVASCDIIGGLAGTLSVALTIHRITGDPELLACARRCGELLEARAEPVGGGVAWPDPAGRHLGGFAHGTAGVAAALARLGATTGESRWHALAERARRFEDTLFDSARAGWLDARTAGTDAPLYPSSWCVGTSGIALGRGIMAENGMSGAAERDLEVALRTTAVREAHDNHCVCHGGFGNVLVLRGHMRPGSGVTEGDITRLLTSMVSTMDAHGVVCAVPAGTFSPGFMLGAAGVGYTLLAMADRSLPSVVGVDDLPC